VRPNLLSYHQHCRYHEEHAEHEQIRRLHRPIRQRASRRHRQHQPRHIGVAQGSQDILTERLPAWVVAA